MRVMTVRVPDTLQSVLMDYANEQGLTRNALILQILWNWIEEHKKE